MDNYKKIDYNRNIDVVLRYVPGHFITPKSHVNYYMDLSDMKSRQREARATGEELAEMYLSSDVIDTILCLNSMEVVGAYLANKLTDETRTVPKVVPDLYIGGSCSSFCIRSSTVMTTGS